MNARYLGNLMLDLIRFSLSKNGFKGSRRKALICWLGLLFFFAGCMYFAIAAFVMLANWWDQNAGTVAYPLEGYTPIFPVLGCWAISAVCFFLCRDVAAPEATLGQTKLAVPSKPRTAQIMREQAESMAAYKRGGEAV